MTKQRRKEIYWAAMFEQVAFEEGFWSSLDRVSKIMANNTHRLPETLTKEGPIDPMDRLSLAIDLCDQ